MCFVYPLDLARTRITAHTCQREVRLIPTISRIYRVDGVKGLYRGFVVSTVVLGLFRAGYFGFYDTFKTYFGDNLLSKYILSQLVNLASTSYSYPLDTVRKRMMMQSGRGIDNMEYSNAVDCFFKILDKEGFKGFYKGYLTNLFKGLATTLVLVLNDEIGKLVEDYKGKSDSK